MRRAQRSDIFRICMRQVSQIKEKDVSLHPLSNFGDGQLLTVVDLLKSKNAAFFNYEESKVFVLMGKIERLSEEPCRMVLGYAVEEGKKMEIYGVEYHLHICYLYSKNEQFLRKITVF